MDGDFILQARIEPNWIRPARGPRAPVAGMPFVTGSGTGFLQRDLSEDALCKPADPVFGQADLIAKRQEGFDAGYAAGIADAAVSREAYRTAAEVHAIGIISTAMTSGCQQTADVADQAAEALARTLIAAMRAVMPNLIERSALNEVGAMLARVLPGLSREPSVSVKVPRDIAAYVAATFDTLAPEHREKITVLGEDAMGPGEARVCWGAGYARRDAARVWLDVMEALQPALDGTVTKDSGNG
jgi:hypothetical protein